MYENFSNVWHEIGWDNFVPVEEYGSRLLTIQFLCTLREVENGVYFRLFGKEYLLSWKTFAGYLDFNKHWPTPASFNNFRTPKVVIGLISNHFNEFW